LSNSLPPNTLLSDFELDSTAHQRALPRNPFLRWTLRFVHTQTAACLFCRPPRLVFAELKREGGKLTVEQERWLELLRQCPGVETFVWRPADWPTVMETLR
jgi:hypothetical protein